MTNAPRVVLVTDQVDAGGKRSHVEALTAGLRVIGWDAECFDAHRLNVIERGWIAGPTRVLAALQPGLGHRWIVPSLHAIFARRLRALARRNPPDLWHVQEPITYRAARAVAGGRPVALTVHGPAHREIASALGLPLDAPVIRWLREIEMLAYHEADAVIAVDRPHAEYVRQLGRTGPTWAIPNFVDTRKFHPEVAPSRLDADTELWIAGRPLLLCPRRLVPKNGVAVALRAARVLADRGRSFALLVAGDGPQRAEMERLREELALAPVVRLIGDVSSEVMPGLCARSAIVLVPSVPSAGVEEATSISALEAQACARPVIVSRLGGLQEIVEHQRTGLLFEPGDHVALAVAIEAVLGDPALAAALGDRALAEVCEHHSHEAGARAYANVYAELGIGT